MYGNLMQESRRRVLPRLMGLGAAAGAVLLAAPRKVAAQTRITLQSLQDQITAILNGTSPTGRTTFIQSTGAYLATSNTFVNMTGRTISFTKLNADSRLRVLYSDQLSMQTNGSFVITEVQFALDGAQAFGYRGYGITSQLFTGVELSAFLAGVAAGSHTIQVQVRNINGSGSFVQYGSGYSVGQPPFTLAVEELP